MKHYQERDKFFYASPVLFPGWDIIKYPSRLAIGMNFKDFKALGADTFNFKIKDQMYSIDRVKALELGKKYVVFAGKLPNLIPKEAFNEVKEAPEQGELFETKGEKR